MMNTKSHRILGRYIDVAKLFVVAPQYERHICCMYDPKNAGARLSRQQMSLL